MEGGYYDGWSVKVEWRYYDGGWNILMEGDVMMEGGVMMEGDIMMEGDVMII